MFFTLITLIILTSIHIGYYYSNVNHNKNQIIIKNLELGLIGIAGILICNYSSAYGLIFNIKNPDTSFWDSINSDYFKLILASVISYSTIYGIYWFLNRKLKIKSYWFIIALLILSIIIYYPGIANSDTDNSYSQFLRGVYGDWQPPLFTIYWQIFRFYGALLLINAITYYGGLTIISYYLDKYQRRFANDMLILFSLTPLVFTQIVIASKDVSFIAVLIDCIALYLMITNTNHKKPIQIILWITYFVFIFLAIGFRLNGIIIAICFIYLAISKLINLDNLIKKRILTTSLSILVTGLFFALNQGITYGVFNANHDHPEQYIQLANSAYIECEVNNSLTMDEQFLTSPQSKTLVCEQALNYYNFDALYHDWNNWGTPYSQPLQFNANQQGLQLSKKQFIDDITNNPLVYLKYRWVFFNNVLFNQYWQTSGTNGDIQNALGDISKAQKIDIRYIIVLLMLILTTVGLTICIKTKNYGISFIILLSCVIQLVFWYFIIPAHAVRYFLWNNIGPILAIALLNVKKQ